MTIFTRLQDQKVLNISDLAATDLMDAEGIFNLKYNREFSSGPIGESVPLSASISQRTFTLNFLIGDETGESQMRINRFFSKSGWYRITDPEFHIEPLDFLVIAVDPAFFTGSSGISITCQSKYGDLVDEERTVLHSSIISGGGYFSGFAGLYHNTTNTSSEIIITLTADRMSIWQPGTEVILRKENGGSVTARIGKTTGDGSLAGWSGYQWSLNSYREVVEGNGVVLPMTARFFKVNPGESASISVSEFGGLVTSDAASISVQVEAVTVKQKEDV